MTIESASNVPGSGDCTDTLNQILDLLTELVVMLDDDRRLVFANKAALGALGMPMESPRGLRVGDLFNCVRAHEAPGGCGESEACKTCGAFQAIIGAQEGRETRRECRIRPEQTEKAFEFLVAASPVMQRGRPLTLCAITDVSAEKRRDALEQTFFHDVLNTAGVVFGYTRLLTVIDAAKAKGFALRTQSAAQIDAYRGHDVASNRTLSVAEGSRTTLFETDLVIIRRVLSNAIKNALEATPENGIVTVGCWPEEGQIVFSVHNPTLMPRAVQLQVFQRSFSTRGKGRGVGTYSMKLFSEKYLHGQVTFNSTAADGTTFAFRFPLIFPAKNL